MIPAECALCGDYEAEHNPPELVPGCRTRNYYGSGRNDYTVCGCPGYEPAQDEEEGQDARATQA